MTTELYRVHRPTSFKQVVGQEKVIEVLDKHLKQGDFPHAILLYGASGCGKTTLARIVAKRLGASDRDTVEVNGAEARGIDDVRAIQQRMGLSPLGGKCRLWIIDECHKMSNDAQTAMLKTLEDTPAHCYFILCTTDPDKILTTVRGRCTQLALKPLKPDEVERVVLEVADKTGISLSKTILKAIISSADGSGRRALKLLEMAAGLESEDKQLEVVSSRDLRRKAFDLARALVWDPRPQWDKVRAILEEIEGEDPEGVRRLILACAGKEVLKGGKGAERGAHLLRKFQYNFFETGRPGLILACWEAFHPE